MHLFPWFRPRSDLTDTLASLERRVAELETLQLSRELEWRETKDKMLRYLKRVQEYERRSATPQSSSRTALLAAKFGRPGVNHGEGE